MKSSIHGLGRRKNLPETETFSPHNFNPRNILQSETMVSSWMSNLLIKLQVIISTFLLVQILPSVEGTPGPAPVTTALANDGGAYSLFPHEDLKTGRSFRLEDDRRLIRDRTPYEPYLDHGRYRGDPAYSNDARNSRYRDEPGLRRITNYRVTRPIEKYNQILFDDERLNYPSVRLPERDRYRDERYFNSYRDRDLPYDRHRLAPFGTPRHLSGFRPSPRLPEPRYPPRPYPPGDSSQAPRIHVFDPASQSFVAKGNGNPGGPPTNANVKPGRLLIPGIATSVEEPGPNVFLNHEEYLDFHTKKALVEMNDQEKKKNGGDGTGNENEKPAKAKQVLFSPSITIGGLRPPVPNSSSGESDESGGSAGKPEHKSQKVKGVVVKSLSNSKPDTPNEEKDGQQTSQPIRIKGISSPRSPSISSSKDISRSGNGIKSQLETEVSERQRTILQGSIIDNHEQQISNPNENFINPSLSPPVIESGFFSVVNHNSGGPLGTAVPVTETITFTPNPFTDFNDRNPFGVSPNLRIEQDSPPLIFLESQDGSGPARSALTGNKQPTNNMIFVRRVKAKNSNGTKPSAEGKSRALKNSGQVDVETTMKIHKSLGSKESTSLPPHSTSFNLQAESSSKTGVVSKIHAHISNCPKLHSAAEIICDVHIRKRHGSPNPQLTVGWKRKFHNATQPDIVLALNKTLAYDEGGDFSEFHDKFNVTLAPGISPMLRSVLLIRRVAPPDTGNYQCEVFDGENRLKSDTLLFLCH